MFDPVYVRPNANRPNSYIANLPVRPDDARAVYVGDYAGEMERRASDNRGDIERRATAEREHQSLLNFVSIERKQYDALKAKFVETYADFDLAAGVVGKSDEITLSDQAKAYLADLAAMEKRRERVDNLTEYAAKEARELPRILEQFEAMSVLAAAGWDMRFSRSMDARVVAYERFNETGNRLAMLGAEAHYANAQRDVQQTALKAGNAALTAGLEGPALFRVADNGRIEFSVEGLEHLSPDARAAEQLKRLVEIMSVRNGLSPLQGAVKKALDIQNAYIAAHPVVAGTVVLPF